MMGSPLWDIAGKCTLEGVAREGGRGLTTEVAETLCPSMLRKNITPAGAESASSTKNRGARNAETLLAYARKDSLEKDDVHQLAEEQPRIVLQRELL